MEMNKHISLETARLAARGKLKGEELARVEEHAATCRECRNRIESIKDADRFFNEWSAGAHGEAYETADRERRRSVLRDVSDKLKKYTPVSAYSSLSELEQRRVKKGVADNLMAGQTGVGAGAVDQEDDDFVLLAASPEKRGESGGALGVTVNEKSGKAYLVNITAWVGDRVKKEGELSLVGSQVEGRSKKGTEYQLTAPLNLLSDKLSKRFKTVPWLNCLNLSKRDVFIEIDNPHFIEKADSLMLAVIASVVKAATGITGYNDVVYSAEVDLQGKLTGVGSIGEKAAFVMSDGDYRLALSNNNKGHLPVQMRESHPGRFIPMSSLGDLYRLLEIQPGDLQKAKLPVQEKRFSTIRTPLWIIVLIALFAVVLLCYAGKGFSTLADLMMARQLGQGGSAVSQYVQPAKWVLSVAVILWLGIQSVNLWDRLRPVPEGSKVSGRLKKTRKYMALQVLWAVLAAYVAINLHLYAERLKAYPNDLEQYEQTEYLESVNGLGWMTGGLSRYKYGQFKKLSAGKDISVLEDAVQVGINMKPSDPMFKETFIVVVSILMDRVNNADYATQALSNYAAYTRYIRNSRDGQQSIADSIDSARDLMSRYNLDKALYEKESFGKIIDDLLIHLERNE